jgi:hypothetical protein
MQSERTFYVEAKPDSVALNLIVPVNHVESCRICLCLKAVSL